MQRNIENLNECCRTCLSLNRIMEPLDRSISNKKVLDLIKSLYPALIDSTHLNVPLNICMLCKQNLLVAYDFQQLVIQSDSQIKEVLRTVTDSLQCKNETENEEVLLTATKTIEPAEDHLEEEEDFEDNEFLDAEYIVAQEIEQFTEEGECEQSTETVKLTVRLYECDVCQKQFDRSSALKEHKKYHAEEDKPHGCFNCSKRFATKEGLTRHVIVHSDAMKHVTVLNDEIYTCTKCEKTFDKQASLAAHCKVHSEKKPDSSTYCDICNKELGSVSSLRRHKKLHDGKSAPTHLCNLCLKQFTSSHALVDHINKHYGVKAYTCPICSKTFHHSSTLRDHIRIHSNVKPFKCDQCSAEFNNKVRSTWLYLSQLYQFFLFRVIFVNT